MSDKALRRGVWLYLEAFGQVFDAEVESDVWLAHQQRLVDLYVATSGLRQRTHLGVDARHQVSALRLHVRIKRVYVQPTQGIELIRTEFKLISFFSWAERRCLPQPQYV